MLEYWEYGIRIFLTEYDEYGTNTGLSRIRMNTVIRIQNTKTRILRIRIRNSVFVVFRILKPVFWIRISVFWIRTSRILNAETPYSEYGNPYSEYETRILIPKPYSEYGNPYSEYGNPYSEYGFPYNKYGVSVFRIQGFISTLWYYVCPRYIVMMFVEDFHHLLALIHSVTTTNFALNCLLTMIFFFWFSSRFSMFDFI